jgi:hypothetical protein
MPITLPLVETFYNTKYFSVWVSVAGEKDFIFTPLLENKNKGLCHIEIISSSLEHIHKFFKIKCKMFVWTF